MRYVMIFFPLKIRSLISIFDLNQIILMGGLTMRFEGSQCCSQAHETCGLSMDLSLLLLLLNRACSCHFLHLIFKFRKPIEMLLSKDIMKTQPWERIIIHLWHEEPIEILVLS